MKAAEKEARRAFIGASDAAAILGVDPWRKPIDVWMRKTGRTVEQDDEEEGPAAWGRFLERTLIERWCVETGLPVKRTGGPRSRPAALSYTHPDYDFIRATPDAVAPRERDGSSWRLPYIVEAKTSRNGRGFGEAGTDEIPRGYKVQAIVQAAVTGAPTVYLPVLIAGQDFRRYVVEPTVQQRGAVIAALVEFWTEYVVPNVEPPEVSEEYLRQKWDTDSGEDLVATDADAKLVEAYRQARTNREQAATVEEERKVAIMARIGDHARLLGPGFTIAWKKTKDVETLDWKSLLPDLEKLVPDERRADAETLRSIHTQTRPGSRVFRPTFHEHEEE